MKPAPKEHLLCAGIFHPLPQWSTEVAGCTCPAVDLPGAVGSLLGRPQGQLAVTLSTLCPLVCIH